jgi:hypothetical protein
MDPHTRATLIAKYKDGYRAVAEALAGATEGELDARPAPGKWTAREIVHHLADSEMRAALRVRDLVVADRPTIAGYDQDAFARRLHYDRPIAASLAAFRAARDVTGELLDRLSDADWLREGTHPEHGRYGMDTWLSVYAKHAHDHAEQIRRARASLANR